MRATLYIWTRLGAQLLLTGTCIILLLCEWLALDRVNNIIIILLIVFKT